MVYFCSHAAELLILFKMKEVDLKYEAVLSKVFYNIVQYLME